ncbi:hypothetical protein [Rhodococcoides kyotonense]|uniref:Urease accessory protein n=1 Tax=Rhodococcoides kyotonense TaxID=398843 RepID=A0A239LGD6_9NOCA|nr:hypothetical protein [Rhodococcus kyotonensis]SNT29686.1 urease accessory protein [Rhodococcus kyotonensis]
METTEILGSRTDERYRGRVVDPVRIPWGDAKKHRQLVRTAADRELALQLPRGSFLAADTVLWDDGETIVAVERPAEDAIVVEFADNVGTDAVRRALLLGYLLGNQHAPLDVTVDRVATPLMTGPETAEATLRALHVTGQVSQVALALNGWSNTSADHHHGHSHD